jgi:glycosyltransferase involved in cell wall biosynthesis
MSSTNPLISVTLPAYNNAGQIGEAIESVLNQTFTDFELVIVNDGSVDSTEQVVKSFRDERIVYVYQENHGASHATNQAVQLARGKYIALFADDDICYPNRLEREYNYLVETGNRLVFSWVDFIGDDGQPVGGPHFADAFFNHPQRSQPEMLNWFFFKANYLCTTSAMLERQVLLEAGLFRVSSAQIPDFGMWLALIKKYPFAMLSEKLIKYRIRANNRNVSSGVNITRAYFELLQVYRDFFDGVAPQLFKAAFAGELRKPDFQAGPEYELEQAFLYLQHAIPLIANLGAERLFHLLQDPATLAVSKANYSFGLPELFLLTQNLDLNNSKEISKLTEWGTSLANEIQKVREAYSNLEQSYRLMESEARKIMQASAETEAEAKKIWQAKVEVDQAWQVKEAQAAKLAARLTQTETANQTLTRTLARYEADLRQLQASRTVRLSGAIGKTLATLRCRLKLKR